MADEKSGSRGFTVVDRRASVMDEATIADAAAQEPAEAKPAYVEQLERALAEKERKLRELAAEVTAVQERVRRETSKDVERQRRALLAELLELADNLDRALGASGAGERGIAEGVGLVRDLLFDKLAAYGVARIEALGARFDPKRHEAQALVPVEDAARDGVVVDVYTQGYAIGADVIRPAGVAVGRAAKG